MNNVDDFTPSPVILPGQELTQDDCISLRHELKFLEESLKAMYSVANYSKEWLEMAPSQRVELEADICGTEHDKEAIEKSLETLVRVY